MSRLNFFWKKANCPVKFKLEVLDAVVRSKLLYGLHTTTVPKDVMQILNAFQLRGLRMILNLKSTFYDRSNTNTKIFTVANKK